MEKRIFAAVLISIGFLWLWAAVAPKLFPDLMKKPVPAKVDDDLDDDDYGHATRRRPPVTVDAPRHDHAARSKRRPPLRAVAPIAADGADDHDDRHRPTSSRSSPTAARELVSFQLTHYKAKPSDKNDETHVELVKEREPSRTDYPVRHRSDRRATSCAARTARSTPSASSTTKGAHVVEYRWSDGAHAVTKTFRFTGEYLFNFAVSVTPPLPYRVAVGPGIRTLGPDEKDNQFIVTGNGVVQRDDSLKVIRREKADTLSIFPAVQYVGIEDNYFLTVLRPEKSTGAILRAIDVPAVEKKEKRRELYAGRQRGAGRRRLRRGILRPERSRKSSTATASRRRCSSASSASSPASSWPRCSG